MSLIVKDTVVPGTCAVTVSFKDSKNRPAKVDGVPTWTASDTTIIDNITVNADGMGATIHITDNIGVSQLTVNADVDMGAGVTNVDFVDTISVIAGDAVSATFAFAPVASDPVKTLDATYPDLASFQAAVSAYTGGVEVDLDGAVLKAGVAPAMTYFTQADGTISTTPVSPPGPLPTTFPDLASFQAAVAAYTGGSEVDLDGAVAKAGTSPALTYFTQADGTISTTPVVTSAFKKK